MQKKEHIARYTIEELKEKLARGEDASDYGFVDSLTEEALDASIDTGEEGMPTWDMVAIDFPLPKRQLTVRFDGDIIDWFKDQGPGYQTRMNAVLRRYVESRKQSA